MNETEPQVVNVEPIVNTLRHQHGWTISQIAELCDLTKTQVREIIQHTAARTSVR